MNEKTATGQHLIFGSAFQLRFLVIANITDSFDAGALFFFVSNTAAGNVPIVKVQRH